MNCQRMLCLFLVLQGTANTLQAAEPPDLVADLVSLRETLNSAGTEQLSQHELHHACITLIQSALSSSDEVHEELRQLMQPKLKRDNLGMFLEMIYHNEIPNDRSALGLLYAFFFVQSDPRSHVYLQTHFTELLRHDKPDVRSIALAALTLIDPDECYPRLLLAIDDDTVQPEMALVSYLFVKSMVEPDEKMRTLLYAGLHSGRDVIVRFSVLYLEESPYEDELLSRVVFWVRLGGVLQDSVLEGLSFEKGED